MDKEKLIEESKIAREKAYVRIPNFQLEQHLLAEDGTIYHGCNIENPHTYDKLCRTYCVL